MGGVKKACVSTVQAAAVKQHLLELDCAYEYTDSRVTNPLMGNESSIRVRTVPSKYVVCTTV